MQSPSLTGHLWSPSKADDRRLSLEPAFIAAATTAEVLAVLSLILQLDQVMPGELHDRIIDGTASRVLDRLS